MKTSQIYFSDIQKLIQLFTQQIISPFIFDPYCRMVEDETEPTETEGDNFKVLVNLAGRLTQFKGFSLEEFDLILDFGKAEVPTDFHCSKFHGINHPNGKMRWLYPGKNLKGVLAFYNESGLRGKVIGKTIRLLSTLGMGKMAADESLTVYSKNELAVKNMMEEHEAIDSIFMGTPGVHQSALVSLIKEGHVNRLLKLPFNKEAKQLLRNEKAALVNLGRNAHRYFKIPKAGLLSGRDAFIIENLKQEKATHVAKFTYLHALVLEELHETSHLRFPLMQCAFWQKIRVSMSEEKPFKKELQPLFLLCRELYSQFNEKEQVTLSCSHGDFTPWNMLYNNNQLSVYDWELWNQQAPALYDLFHFHYQRGIMMQHVNYSDIWQQIGSALDTEPMLRVRRDQTVDIDQLHRLYLLRTVAFFIRVYDRQELTLQNQWQLKCWTESLQFELSRLKAKELGCRKTFMNELNAHLQNIPHAFLKFDYENLNALPLTSDLDIAIGKEETAEVLDFCRNHVLVERVRLRRKSFMNAVELFFFDGAYLSLDLIHRFQRKEMNMLSTTELLAESKMSERGVKVPALKHDLAYTYLFYTLNHAPVPLRYHPLFSQATAKEKSVALAHLKSRYDLNFDRIEQLFIARSEDRKKLLLQLKKSSWTKRTIALVNYAIDVCKGFIKPDGFIITFSGVDGVGKSTVLELVEEKLTKQYRKEVVRLRHRPGILPILSAIKHGKQKAEQIASVSIPRKGDNQSFISSLLRFAYYYTDYLFGQLYVYFCYVARGKVVLYDRYYFDFINDTRRSNIQINRNIAKALYNLILKPKLNIFLYADASTILLRKQELNAQDIRELTKNYHSLFRELSEKSKYSRYASIENLDLKKTIQQILKEFDRVA